MIKKLLCTAVLAVTGGVFAAVESTEVAPVLWVEAATKQELDRLTGLLTEHAFSWSQVPRVHVFLRDMADFNGFNGSYEQYLKDAEIAQFPARVTVENVADDAPLVTMYAEAVREGVSLSSVVDSKAQLASPYSLAVEAKNQDERSLFGSGQLPRQEDGSIEMDVLKATTLALEANTNVLKVGSMDWKNVTKVVLYYPATTAAMKQAILDQVVVPYLSAVCSADQVLQVEELVVKQLPFNAPIEIEVTATARAS